MQTGIILALSAYFLWGILPVYWKLLKSVPPFEILCHRIIWSAIFMSTILYFQGSLTKLKAAFARNEGRRNFILSGLLLGINWFTYVWAVNSGYIIEASMGYFINPLVTVCLGLFLFAEKIRVLQYFSILLAAIGVTYLTYQVGQLPWISLIIAFSFAFYSSLKKTSTSEASESLALETLILFPIAITFLLHLEYNQQAAFAHSEITMTLLLIGTGPVTLIPLLLFGMSVKRIPLVYLGLLQYLAPTLQFLIGVFLYKEIFDMNRFVGFCFIWTALIIFAGEGLWRFKKGNLKRVI
ncbi:EamA family transporter RarD [Candidatus Riflebacteria bacterium]